jgi:4'-phosphopantetheinyl transferase
MKQETQMIFEWPEVPALPPPGLAVLIRVRTPAARVEARRELRAVLRRVLADWSGCSEEQMPLCESARGPVWAGTLNGLSLDISLSHADGEGWMGLIRGGSIGIDVMRVQAIPEVESLAQIYLGPAAWKTIRNSRDPDLSFALAWTDLEARLKLLKQPLLEFSGVPAAGAGECASRHFLFRDDLVVALAHARVPAESLSLKLWRASRLSVMQIFST